MDPLVEQKIEEMRKLAAKGVPPGFIKGKAPRPRFLREMEELNERMSKFMRVKEWNEMMEKEREEKRAREVQERRARRLAQKNAEKERP